MRYLILLEGQGGELDRRACESEDKISGAVVDLATDCTLSPGDTIKVIDTAPDRE